jgi:hypothetical protein
MRKFIAMYEIIGGIITLAILLISLGISIGVSKEMFSPWTSKVVFSLILSFLFSILVVISGIMLLRETKAGYILSIIAQFVQMITIQTLNFHYLFYAAPLGLGATFGVGGVNFIFGLGASYTFSFSQQPVDGIYIGFTVIALIFFILLLLLKRKTKKLIRF